MSFRCKFTAMKKIFETQSGSKQDHFWCISKRVSCPIHFQSRFFQSIYNNVRHCRCTFLERFSVCIVRCYFADIVYNIVCDINFFNGTCRKKVHFCSVELNYCTIQILITNSIQDASRGYTCLEA